MQPKIRKNDRHDVARNELILIRCGQHLWLRLKSLKRQNLSEEPAIWEALETVWETKRQVGAELKVKRPRLPVYLPRRCVRKTGRSLKRPRNECQDIEIIHKEALKRQMVWNASMTVLYTQSTTMALSEKSARR
jgi:hypothetical protein